MEIFLNVGIVICTFLMCINGVALISHYDITMAWSDRLIGRFVGSVIGLILFALGKMFL